MNRLNRDLQRGEVVVLKSSVLTPEYQALEERLFVITDGPGMKVAEDKYDLTGHFLHDGPAPVTVYLEANDISISETIAYQEEHRTSSTQG